MAESLKKETAKGVVWSAVERFSSGGVLFLADIILARMLTPNDFGLIAIVSIFIQIAQTFIDSGFSNALIQKKDRSQIDYSTVFYFNIGIAIILYIAIYVAAPYISKYFNNPELNSLTRIVSLNLIIGALISVQKTRLTIELNFKTQAIITLISSLFATVIAIGMAYNGFGVWSLVFLSLINITLQTVLIYFIIKWYPSLIFSTTAFKRLFGFSSKLLGASLIHLLYRNVYPVIIGKYFSSTVLGFYNRAETYAMFPAQSIGPIISRVAFPIFSKIQDDNEKLSIAYSKYIVYASFIIFPIMIGLLTLAKPLTLLVLKDQWLPMVPMLQILCLDWMTNHLSMINLNVLYIKGRSDLAFKLEIIKKFCAFLIFFISLYWGIIGVCWGRVIYSYCAVYFNSYYTKKLIGIGLVQQMKDIIKPLCYSTVMGIMVYILSNILECATTTFLTIIICVILGIVIYLIIIYIFDKNIIRELNSIISR